MRKPRLALLSAPLVASAALFAQAPRPNIVFILADDLGYGELGCYGEKLIATPNVDRLAAEGMRFTQFYAGCTVCAPSRSVLMTGQHMGHTERFGRLCTQCLEVPHQDLPVRHEAVHRPPR